MKSALILALSVAIAQHVAAVCNVCNKGNGVACNSERGFYLCENDVAKNQTTFFCSGTKICTKLPAICVQKTESAIPACGDTSNCGICKGAASDGGYACTSRNTHTLCFGGALTEIRSTCPENQICDVNRGQAGQNPCVPSCRFSQIEICDRYAAIDVPTTQAPPTASTPTTTTTATNNGTNMPTTTQSPAAAFCSKQTASGRYPLPSDSTCRDYVYCYWRGGVLQATPRRCPRNRYYDPDTTTCVQNRPQGCI